MGGSRKKTRPPRENRQAAHGPQCWQRRRRAAAADGCGQFRAPLARRLQCQHRSCSLTLLTARWPSEARRSFRCHAACELCRPCQPRLVGNVTQDNRHCDRAGSVSCRCHLEAASAERRRWRRRAAAAAAGLLCLLGLLLIPVNVSLCFSHLSRCALIKCGITWGGNATCILQADHRACALRS